MKQLKNHLNEAQNTRIVLADFLENYTMTVQDKIQSFHFNKSQCTINPLVLYLPSSNQSSSYIQQSMIFWGDDWNYNTSFVFVMQQKLVAYLKQNYSHIAHIEYFSDGCAGQHKNFKNLLNLTFQQNDFGLSANQNFFATSHAKSSCDGLGSIIKRKLFHRSLAHLYQHQILTAKDAFNLCKTAMPFISFHFLSKENLAEVCQVLTERYVQGHTITGNRSHHVFSSKAVSNKKFKITAEDERYDGCYKFFDSQQQNVMVNVGNYVAVKYDMVDWHHPRSNTRR